MCGGLYDRVGHRSSWWGVSITETSCLSSIHIQWASGSTVKEEEQDTPGHTPIRKRKEEHGPLACELVKSRGSPGGAVLEWELHPDQAWLCSVRGALWPSLLHSSGSFFLTLHPLEPPVKRTLGALQGGCTVGPLRGGAAQWGPSGGRCCTLFRATSCLQKVGRPSL